MNKNLEIWEDIFQNNEWGKYPSLAVVRFVAKNFYKVPNRKDIRILELGCGTGANLWYCAREGFSVIGLDGSKTAIHRMIDRFEKENLSEFLMDTKVGDYFDTLNDIKDNSIDAVIDVESLYCNRFIRTREIIIKIFDKLKVGGKFLSQTFADGTWGFENCKENIDMLSNDYHVVFPKEGPIANEGLGRYTTFEDINLLYKLDNNAITSTHRQDYIYEDKKSIKEWIIESIKVK